MSDTEVTETEEVPEVPEVTPEEENISLEAARKLRSEAKTLRDRAKNAEATVEHLSRELFTARVAATGKVENPAEIAYNADILDDTDAISAAVDSAITERPYIKARRVIGDVGQGVHGGIAAPVDFSTLFRA